MRVATYKRIAQRYRESLAKQWPDVAVYYREDPNRRNCIEIRAVGDTWDPEKERTAHQATRLVAEAKESQVRLDVGVRFRKEGDPNLTGFEPV